MAMNYNITRWQSENYLFSELRTVVGAGFVQDNTKVLRKLHLNFFNFIETTAFNVLFKLKRSDFVDHKITECIKNKTLIYNKTITKHKIVKFRRNTWKISYKERLPELDLKQMKLALPANLIQGSDASLAHKIVQQCLCMVIHDSFIFHVSDYTTVFDCINGFFSAKIPEKKYSSCFILL